MIAKTPQPPYYAVIFSSIRTSIDEGYYEMNQKLEALAREQEGFLGVESARNELGVSVSYWSSLEAIKKWKTQSEHMIAKRLGKEKWYTTYKTRIAKVEIDYEF